MAKFIVEISDSTMAFLTEERVNKRLADIVEEFDNQAKKAASDTRTGRAETFKADPEVAAKVAELDALLDAKAAEADVTETAVAATTAAEAVKA